MAVPAKIGAAHNHGHHAANRFFWHPLVKLWRIIRSIPLRIGDSVKRHGSLWIVHNSVGQVQTYEHALYRQIEPVPNQRLECRADANRDAAGRGGDPG